MLAWAGVPSANRGLGSSVVARQARGPPGTLVLGRGPEGAGATLCWPAVQANLGGRIPAAANAETRVLQTFPESSRGPGGLSEMPTGTKPVQATQLPRGEGQRGTHPGTTQQRHERHTRAAKSKPKYGARPPHRRTSRGNPRTAACPSKAEGPPHYPGAAPLYHARPDPAPNKFPGRRRHWRTYNRLPLHTIANKTITWTGCL